MGCKRVNLGFFYYNQTENGAIWYFNEYAILYSKKKWLMHALTGGRCLRSFY